MIVRVLVCLHPGCGRQWTTVNDLDYLKREWRWHRQLTGHTLSETRPEHRPDPKGTPWTD